VSSDDVLRGIILGCSFFPVRPGGFRVAGRLVHAATSPGSVISYASSYPELSRQDRYSHRLPCTLADRSPIFFRPLFSPCLGVISRRLVNATQEERRDLVIDKASLDAFLYRTLSWLDSLKRCRPRGSFVDNDVNRRTRTKKYIDSLETR